MLQLELGPEIEVRIADAARTRGISVNDYVREKLDPQLPGQSSQPVFKSTLEERLQAVKELSTFAKDRGINIELPEGMSIRDYIREATGF
jgi:hypothetical protein